MMENLTIWAAEQKACLCKVAKQNPELRWWAKPRVVASHHEPSTRVTEGRVAKKILYALSIFLFLVGPVFAKEEPSLEEFLYGGFKTVQTFGHVDVQISGDAEKIGLNKNELKDLLLLKFKNNFADIPYKEDPNWPQKVKDKELAQKVGIIYMKVWIVGDDYPIAYHLSFDAGNLSSVRFYEDALLGYGNRENVPETVKKTIDQFVERVAITFFKVRGDL